MGKIKGFMEFDRLKESVIDPKERKKIITNLRLLLKKRNFKSKERDVWIVEYRFVTVVAH